MPIVGMVCDRTVKVFKAVRGGMEVGDLIYKTCGRSRLWRCRDYPGVEDSVNVIGSLRVTGGSAIELIKFVSNSSLDCEELMELGKFQGRPDVGSTA